MQRRPGHPTAGLKLLGSDRDGDRPGPRRPVGQGQRPVGHLAQRVSAALLGLSSVILPGRGGEHLQGSDHLLPGGRVQQAVDLHPAAQGGRDVQAPVLVRVGVIVRASRIELVDQDLHGQGRVANVVRTGVLDHRGLGRQERVPEPVVAAADHPHMHRRDRALRERGGGGRQLVAQRPSGMNHGTGVRAGHPALVLQERRGVPIPQHRPAATGVERGHHLVQEGIKTVQRDLTLLDQHGQISHRHSVQVDLVQSPHLREHRLHSLLRVHDSPPPSTHHARSGV